MTITYSYTVTDFDTSTGRVAFNSRATDGEFTYTIGCMYWLIPDSFGRVPSGAQLNDILSLATRSSIPSELFFGFKTLATVGITNPEAVRSLIPPAGGVTTTLAFISGYFTPLTSFRVASSSGIVAGMTFTIPTVGPGFTVTSVSGPTVNFTPSASPSPNFVVGTSLTFNPA